MIHVETNCPVHGPQVHELASSDDVSWMCCPAVQSLTTDDSDPMLAMLSRLTKDLT